METSDIVRGFNVNKGIRNTWDSAFIAAKILISRARPILEPMLVICSDPPRFEVAKERRRLLLLFVAFTHVSN